METIKMRKEFQLLTPNDFEKSQKISELLGEAFCPSDIFLYNVYKTISDDIVRLYTIEKDGFLTLLNRKIKLMTKINRKIAKFIILLKERNDMKIKHVIDGFKACKTEVKELLDMMNALHTKATTYYEKQEKLRKRAAQYNKENHIS